MSCWADASYCSGSELSEFRGHETEIIPLPDPPMSLASIDVGKQRGLMGGDMQNNRVYINIQAYDAARTIHRVRDSPKRHSSTLVATAKSRACRKHSYQQARRNKNRVLASKNTSLEKVRLNTQVLPFNLERDRWLYNLIIYYCRCG